MNPDEEDALRKLGAALEVVSQWQHQVIGDPAGHETTPGSQLATDDVLAHPFMVSPAPWSAQTAAVSHLGRVS